MDSAKKNTGSVMGMLSVAIPVVMILLVLNWFFKITPYQKLGGLPLLLTPFTSIIGLVLGSISVKLGSNKLGKIGVASNVALFGLPTLYWIIGSMISG